MTIEQLAAAAQAVSVVFLLITALYGLGRRWWVPGWQYIECEKDRDFWRDTALRGLSAAETLAKLAERDLHRG